MQQIFKISDIHNLSAFVSIFLPSVCSFNFLTLRVMSKVSLFGLIMGSAQSRARSKLGCIFPSSSDYAQLPSSPTKQHLLVDDAFNYYNLPEQYETAIRGILAEATTNAKKVTDLEYKIERLVSKNLAMEVNIRKFSADMKKVIELERTIEGLLSKNALMEKTINENTTIVKKVSMLENKIELAERFLLLDNKTAERNQKGIVANEKKNELLEKLLVSNNTTVEINQKEIIAHGKKIAELDQNVARIEKLLQSKNAAVEGNIGNPEAKADGLALMSLTRDITLDLELDKGMEEPEYVNRMMGLILMLIFVISVLIGIQL